MKSSYNFLSDKEPTDKQLQKLMQDVLVDVKNDLKFRKKSWKLFNYNKLRKLKYVLTNDFL